VKVGKGMKRGKGRNHIGSRKHGIRVGWQHRGTCYSKNEAWKRDFCGILIFRNIGGVDTEVVLIKPRHAEYRDEHQPLAHLPTRTLYSHNTLSITLRHPPAYSSLTNPQPPHPPLNLILLLPLLLHPRSFTRLTLFIVILLHCDGVSTARAAREKARFLDEVAAA